MAHPDGAGSEDDFRLDFDPRVRLEFHGSKLSSDGGLLLYRELDEGLCCTNQLRDSFYESSGYCQVVGGRLCFIGGGWVTPPFLRCRRTIG